MTPTPDDAPRWEVVPNFRDRTGVPLYRPPRSGSSDPQVVVGRRSPTNTYLPALITVSSSSFVFSVLGRTLVAGAISVGIIAAVVILTAALTARRRRWKVPRLVTTAEGVTVTDVHGQVRSAPWSEVGSPSLQRQKDGRDEVVQLAWTDPAGARISLNLGDTIDLVAVRDAIAAHAPSTLELRSEAKYALGKEGSDER